MFTVVHVKCNVQFSNGSIVLLVEKPILSKSKENKANHIKHTVKAGGPSWQ
jgi:hypothetical protein